MQTLARNRSGAGRHAPQALVGEISLSIATAGARYLVTKDGAGLCARVQVQAIAEGGVDRLVQQAKVEVANVEERPTLAADSYEAAQPLKEEALQILGRASVVAVTLTVILRYQVTQLVPPHSDRECTTIDHLRGNATTGGRHLSIIYGSYLNNMLTLRLEPIPYRGAWGLSPAGRST
jgi:hypothetical protein